MRKVLNLGITIYRGGDFAAIFLVPSSTGPVDLTGYSFDGVMKSSTDPEAPIIATFDFTVRDQTTFKGQVDWLLSAANTETIDTSVVQSDASCRLATPFLYDVFMTDSLGVRSRIIQGIAYVSPNVTEAGA